ncbi:MAG: sensor histidine kinase [Nitrososphaerota archaeon]
MWDSRSSLRMRDSIPEEALFDKIRMLKYEKQRLAEQNVTQQKMLVTLERKIVKFEEIKDQRDWLLDEMTKKIGELSHFQSELFKAERLSAIGEMAARLAHDMRNPLAIIKNAVELVNLKHSTKISADLLELFASIDRASSRLVFQLDDVLNFVRGSPLSCTKHSLHDIMESSINKIVEPDQISIQRPTNAVSVFCDGEKISAVFTNLIMNAIQAMENCGEIVIQFDETDDDITFRVQDSGPGVPESILDKIFEPLFTTKSCGTGLGLPAVKTIVQQHQGMISVTNHPTVFSVSIPKDLS